MERRQRFAFTTGQKAVLWIGVLLCLWQVVQIPGVFDAILTFYAAGVIPGTDIVLGPDTILRFMFASLFSTALIICYRMYGRRPKVDVRQAPLTGKKLQLYASFIEAVRPVRRVQHVSQGIWGRGVRRADAVANGLRRTLEWLWPCMQYAGKFIAYGAALMWRAFVSAVIWIMAVESALFVWLWRWAEPHVRQFDRWLERKVNANPAGATLVGFLRSCGQTFSSRSGKKTAISPHDRPSEE